MDKSWMGAKRNTTSYVRGVDAFMKFAVNNYNLSNKINPKKNHKNSMSMY